MRLPARLAHLDLRYYLISYFTGSNYSFFLPSAPLNKSFTDFMAHKEADPPA